MATEPSSTTARVLVVDDVAAVRRMLERVLTDKGYAVVSASDGIEAQQLVAAEEFDLVLSDVAMPGADGISLLAAIRARDPELPVILLTGAPTTASAISAVNLAATAYLSKPISPDVLTAEVERAVKLRRLALARRDANEQAGASSATSAEIADLAESFERALAGLFMLYQPIVSWARRTVFANEALVRSSEPSMAHPLALFDAAEKLDRLHDLGRAIRTSCAETFTELGAKSRLFLNLHPHDLLDETLFDPRAVLAPIAQQVVFELTERARLDDVADLRERVAALRAAGYRIAIDDLGAGYSGLNTFATLRPEYVKLDMALVRSVDADPTKQRIARMLVELSTDLNISVVAEGVETRPELDHLVPFGCDLLQGYYFARPGAPFPEPRFDGGGTNG